MEKQKYTLIQFILFLSVFVNRSPVFAAGGVCCINPNGNLGSCVSYADCPSILEIITKQKANAYEFARKSVCDSNGQRPQPYVCCTTDTNFHGTVVFPDATNAGDHEQNNKPTLDSSLFPTPPTCGPEFNGKGRVYGGDEAELGEFPWLANLEHSKDGVLKSVCAGNILNHRYILTVAHCIVGRVEQIYGKLVSVRVGAHNTTQPLDCNRAECLEPSRRFNVEETITHASYDISSSYKSYNDIALVRTDRYIEYSIAVIPVCLPNVFPARPRLSRGAKMMVAGWGATERAKSSEVKRKVELPYVENNDCHTTVVAPEQLCAGGEFYRDTCKGDSGGGLVRFVNNAWIVEGLTSFGSVCGIEKPGVYTRVESYIPWIYANVRP